MSGLVKLVKKTFKKVREVGKKIMKSKIFKVVAIAAAVVFTGGAALGALGAVGAAGGTFMGTMATAFQAGLSALGSVGSAMWSGVQAAGSAISGFMTGAGGAAGAGAGTASTIAADATLAGLAAPVAGAAAAPAAAGAAGAAGFLANPLVQAAAVSTGGQMISGYAQGRAAEEQNDQIEKKRMARDQYGYDGHGRKTGDLVDPRARLADITASQDPTLRQGMAVSLDNAPGGGGSPSLEHAMRNKLLLSLDSLSPGAA